MRRKEVRPIAASAQTGKISKETLTRRSRMSRKTNLRANPQQDELATAEGAPSTPLVHQAESFSGPLPPPSLLVQYDKLVKNGAERIFQHAEREQLHRHEIETRESLQKELLVKNSAELNAEVLRRYKAGQYVGFAIVILSLFFAFVGLLMRADSVVICAFLAVPAVAFVAKLLPFGGSKKQGE